MTDVSYPHGESPVEEMRLGTVLLVDDETNVLEGICRAFYTEPYELICANSAEEALGLLRANTVDIVVSDQIMPGVIGTAFLTRTRHEFPETARYLLTGQATKEVLFQAIYESAISGFFVKPVNWVDLAASLRHVLQQRSEVIQAMNLLRTRAGQFHQGIQRGHTPVYVQIDTPSKIMASLLLPFYTQKKKVLLGDIQKRYFMPATLHGTNETAILIEPSYSCQHQQGERLVVVFPVLDQQSYILSAWIDTIDDNRLQLKFQIPFGDNHVGLRKHQGYVPDLLTVRNESHPLKDSQGIGSLEVRDLKPGMVLNEDVKTRSGVLMIPKETRLNDALIERLQKFEEGVGIEEPIHIRIL